MHDHPHPVHPNANGTHMSDIQHLIDALVQFRDERDWAQFHDSNTLAAASPGIER